MNKTSATGTLDALQATGRGRKARLFQDTVIRIDAAGFYWLMNRQDQGWGSAGRRYSSLRAITERYAVQLGNFDKDRFSAFIPVKAL